MATLKDLKELFAGRKPVDVAIEISGFTGFRTTDINELSNDEVNRLYEIHRPKERDLDAEWNALKEELIRKEWKSKILATAEKAGVKEPMSFAKFNNWMISRSMFKKHLEAHSLDELRQLHKQLHGVMTNNARSANRPTNKAWWDKAETLKNWN